MENKAEETSCHRHPLPSPRPRYSFQQIIFSAFQDVKGANFVICNSADELKPNTISALQRKKPIVIGRIFPQGFKKSSVVTSLWSEPDCTHWLNTKPEGSVLYLSFGSYTHVKRKDLIEIATELLLSKVNFVWVLRLDILSSDDVDPLHEGYREDLGDHAMIIPWCFQIGVVNHPAIGGYLAHFRWNSMLDSIGSEVPLYFPLLTDQFTNRKLAVDEWRIGLNLSEKNRVPAELSTSSLTPGGSLRRNFDKFIEYLEEMIRGRSPTETEHQTM